MSLYMKKTVVIGAGFGGLALAIRLQAAGIPTLLLEQRDKPGGRAYVYQERGLYLRCGSDGNYRPNGTGGASLHWPVNVLRST